MISKESLKKVSFIILLLIFLLCIASCNTTEPPDPPVTPIPVLKLELEDVSCTEAWITLTTIDLSLPAELTLKQYNPMGDSISKVLLLNTPDTLLYIDSLLPNKSYNFKLSGIGNPLSGINSNELNATTMDTTSHNFTFETWTFGGSAGSSVLYDVAIIDENNIIAVGEIMVADSSPNGYTTYGALQWDGQSWMLKRLQYGNNITVTPRGILVVNPNEIYLASGSIFKWDGISDTVNLVFSRIHLNNPNGTINKLWGSSKEAIYGIGNNGSLVFFNGTAWKKIESGTDLNINDIWGDYNEKTGQWEILAVASNYSSSWEKDILLIKNNEVDKLSTDSNPSMEPLLTCWFKSNSQYYVAGAGIYQKHLLQDSLWKHNLFNITTFATTSIRGNGINDVFGVGAFGDFVHFNGVDWKNDYEKPLLVNGSYTKVEVKNNLIVAVGSNQVSINSEAVILVGRR